MMKLFKCALQMTCLSLNGNNCEVNKAQGEKDNGKPLKTSNRNTARKCKKEKQGL